MKNNYKNIRGEKMKNFVIVLLFAITMSFAEGTYFKYEQTGDGNFVPVLINTTVIPLLDGQSLEAGDEIGLFTSTGVCAGALVWTDGSTKVSINANPDNSMTSGVVEGFVNGDTIYAKIYDISENKVIDASISFDNDDGLFNTNNFYYNVSSLAAVTPVEVISGAYDLTIDRGDTAIFFITVSGGLPIQYQWQKMGDGQSSYSDISGANSDTLKISSVEMSDVASYRCVASNSAGKDTSSSGILTVVNKLPVLSAVTPQTINEDGELTITLSMMSASDEDDLLTDASIRILSGSNYTVSSNRISPSADWNGQLTVPIYVIDGVAGSTPSDTLDMTVTVNSINDAPEVLSPFVDTIIDVNKDYVSNILADYFDDVDTDDSLVITVSGLPSGFAFTNGVISGSSNVETFNTVIVTATDDSSASVSDTFAFDVMYTSAITEVYDNSDRNVKGIVAVPNIVTHDNENVRFIISKRISGSGTITVFDLLGNVIDKQSIVVNGGGHYMWDMTNEGGVPVTSGLYQVLLDIVSFEGRQVQFKTKVGVKSK